ncbi:MAG: sigma-70 family RNA polymerase sigma factor [Victivallales bacterium]|nr:sigma-70 family RNA polymerase sigma factor [Victivallales bacterium]
MDNATATYLATKVLLGIATEEDRNQLAAYSVEEAKKVAKWCVKNGRLPQADVNDVAQDAAIRAISHVWSFRLNPRQYGTSWGTYLNAITRRVVADYGRRAQREQQTLATLAGELEDED